MAAAPLTVAFCHLDLYFTGTQRLTHTQSLTHTTPRKLNSRSPSPSLSLSERCLSCAFISLYYSPASAVAEYEAAPGLTPGIGVPSFRRCRGWILSCHPLRLTLHIGGHPVDVDEHLQALPQHKLQGFTSASARIVTPQQRSQLVITIEVFLPSGWSISRPNALADNLRIPREFPFVLEITLHSIGCMRVKLGWRVYLHTYGTQDLHLAGRCGFSSTFSRSDFEPAGYMCALLLLGPCTCAVFRAAHVRRLMSKSYELVLWVPRLLRHRVPLLLWPLWLPGKEMRGFNLSGFSSNVFIAGKRDSLCPAVIVLTSYITCKLCRKGFYGVYWACIDRVLMMRKHSSSRY